MESEAISANNLLRDFNDDGQPTVSFAISEDGANVLVDEIKVKMTDAVVTAVSVVDEEENLVCATFCK